MVAIVKEPAVSRDVLRWLAREVVARCDGCRSNIYDGEEYRTDAYDTTLCRFCQDRREEEARRMKEVNGWP